jgi:hypothetical protein
MFARAVANRPMNPIDRAVPYSIALKCCLNRSRFRVLPHSAFLFLALQSDSWAADRLMLSWEDNSLNETGFRVERAINNGRFVPIATVAADVVEYVDNDVSRGAEYAYRVCAFNEVGDSPFANVVRGGFISRITNLSIRSAQVSARNPLMVGFVITGSSSKSILVRGVGPTLTQFGLTQVLSDPVLSLYHGATLFASNDDWRLADNSAQVAVKTLQVGAFPLPETGLDTALLTVLSSGAIMAELKGKSDDPGEALLEIYDADAIHSVRFVNFSLRMELREGVGFETVGFVVSGNHSKQVLIRAIGPALADYGVTNLLSDPKLALFRHGEVTPVHENDDWGGTSELKAAFVATAASALSDASRDAALLIALEPGAYLVEVTGVGSLSGSGLIEVYEVR